MQTLKPRKQRPLKDLLDQWVLFDGYLDTWVEREDDNVFVLVKRVVIRDMETGKPIPGKEFGHCWLNLDRECWEATVEIQQIVGRRIQCMDRVLGAGRVYRYFRSNNSVDYGIDTADHALQTEASVEGHRKMMNRCFSKLDRAVKNVRFLPPEKLWDIDFVDETIVLIQDRKADWRLFGRSPKDAIANLKIFRRAVDIQLDSPVSLKTIYGP